MVTSLKQILSVRRPYAKCLPVVALSQGILEKMHLFAWDVSVPVRLGYI